MKKQRTYKKFKAYSKRLDTQLSTTSPYCQIGVKSNKFERLNFNERHSVMTTNVSLYGIGFIIKSIITV